MILVVLHISHFNGKFGTAHAPYHVTCLSGVGSKRGTYLKSPSVPDLPLHYPSFMRLR